MSQAVILHSLRSPIGKFQGALAPLAAPDLAAQVVKALLAAVPGALPSEAIFGNVVGAGVGQAPARQAALRGGLPASVSALTINKVCGSGLKAIQLAANAVRLGDHEVVVAGGTARTTVASSTATEGLCVWLSSNSRTRLVADNGGRTTTSRVPDELRPLCVTPETDASSRLGKIAK